MRDIKSNPYALAVKLADRLHNVNSARKAYPSFQKKYIKETEEFYIPLAKDTIFEKDLYYELLSLKTIYRRYEESISGPSLLSLPI